MGGDTTPILDAILETGTGYVCCPAVPEGTPFGGTNQQMFMEKMRAHPEVMVRINMDPAHLMGGVDPRPIACPELAEGTSENFEAVKKEVDRVLALANNRGKVCIGTGCLPYETDPQMVLKTREYILSRNVP